MKKILAFLAIPLLVGTVWIGCAGTPTKLETKLFNIQTNYVPVTNAVIVTNPDGTRTTNLVPGVTPIYVYAKGPGETQVTQIGTDVGNVFGVGSLVGGAAGVLFGLWRWVRSNKVAQTAGDLAQNIETIREFIKQLPNGATYDSVLVNWLTQHQAEGGVLNEVIGILKNQVNNPEAKAAADQVMATITDLLKPKS